MTENLITQFFFQWNTKNTPIHSQETKVYDMTLNNEKK